MVSRVGSSHSNTPPCNSAPCVFSGSEWPWRLQEPAMLPGSRDARCLAARSAHSSRRRRQGTRVGRLDCKVGLGRTQLAVHAPPSTHIDLMATCAQQGCDAQASHQRGHRPGLGEAFDAARRHQPRQTKRQVAAASGSLHRHAVPHLTDTLRAEVLVRLAKRRSRWYVLRSCALKT